MILFSLLSKWAFAQTKVDYLGHVTIPKGVAADSAKVGSTKTWPHAQGRLSLGVHQQSRLSKFSRMLCLLPLCYTIVVENFSYCVWCLWVFFLFSCVCWGYEGWCGVYLANSTVWSGWVAYLEASLALRGLIIGLHMHFTVKVGCDQFFPKFAEECDFCRKISMKSPNHHVCCNLYLFPMESRLMFPWTLLIMLSYQSRVES